MTPGRIQLCRTKGWRTPADVVKIARPTRWGNPFRLAPRQRFKTDALRDLARQGVVAAFKSALEGGFLSFTIADVRRELRGRVLGCWCRPDVLCHGDVLLAIANADP